MKKLIILVISLSMLITFSLEIFSATTPSEIDKDNFIASIFDADIKTLREALDEHLFSSRELTQFYLDRINKYNPTFNCFITICDDALEQADKRDSEIASGESKPLLGIPVVVKDNIEVAGYPTTNGYKKTDKTSSANAEIVQKLLDAGAVILGKTNMSTEAQEARRTSSAAIGETFNAYNIKLASGGSSGGSAVAVSLNFAPAGLGTDTNSSLRFPSALNGCISLRPTQGLVSRDGVIILNSKRDTPGVITRSVDDQAIMLDVMTGSSFYASLDGSKIKGTKIGILKELSYPTSLIGGRTKNDVDTEVSASFEQAINELKNEGAEIVTVSMKNIFSLSSKCVEPNSKADTNKEKYHNEFKKLLSDNNLDAIIFPTYLSTPMYTGKSDDGSLAIYNQTYINNCNMISPPLGTPEITVPIGRHSNGAGIGMEICSLRGNDQLVLDLAFAYTEKYDHRDTPDTAPNLYSSTVSLKELIDNYKNGSNTETIPETLSDNNIPTADTEGGISMFTVLAIFIAVIAVVVFISSAKKKKRKKRKRRSK